MTPHDPQALAAPGEGARLRLCARSSCRHPVAAHRMQWPDVPCEATVHIDDYSYRCNCVTFIPPRPTDA